MTSSSPQSPGFPPLSRGPEEAPGNSTGASQGPPRTVSIGDQRYVLLSPEEYEELLARSRRSPEAAAFLGRSSISRELRALRLRSRKTLATVAAKAGIAAGTLSRIETGKRDPNVATVRAILTALGADSRRP